MKRVWKTTLLALFLPLTTAHLRLSTPTPYAPDTGITQNNSPLFDDGSNYPCKGPLLPPTTFTPLTINKASTLTLFGTVLHGGGSCQISISPDLPPYLTRNSTFKVIKSWIGGYPVPDPTSSKLRPAPLSFIVPENVPSGEATLAWTWFNRLGNREMYMECAPVRVVPHRPSSLDGTTEEGFSALPDMLIANLGSCGDVVEGVNVSCRFAEGKSPDLGFSTGKLVQKSNEAFARCEEPGVVDRGACPVEAEHLMGVGQANNGGVGNRSMAEQLPQHVGGEGCNPGSIVCNGTALWGTCQPGKYVLVWQPVNPGLICQNGRMVVPSRRRVASRNFGAWRG